MVAVVLFGVMFLLMFLGVPIVFSIGAAGTAALVFCDVSVPLTLVVQRFFTGVDSFTLCCIPFFILCGQFMACGDLSKRLLRLAEAFVGHIRGGLALINVVFSMFFGGISGSSSADVAAEGPILMPLMKQAGYDEGYTVALTATTATIGVIIPPSNMMIIYASVAGAVSIADMFLGGIIPGLLMGVGFGIAAYIIAVKRNYPKGEKMTGAAKREAIRQGLPPLVTFIIIIGGILLGVFTPTESAIIAAVYNFVLSMFVYKSVKWSDLPKMFLETAYMTGAVLMLIGVSSIFSWLLAYTKIPNLIVNAIFSLTSAKYVVLLLMLLVFLLIGMVMDDAPACIIFVPMFAPVAYGFGMDPVQFGVFCVMCLAIGQYTPPVGAVLFLSCKIGQCPIEKAARALIPFAASAVICCILVMLIPPLTTFLPELVKTISG